MSGSGLFFLVTFAVYAIISIILFEKVYLTSNLVIDEEFHLPLGEQYCHFNFKKWDPKVTTLPGLYLISSLLLGPLGLCSIYWLRTVSLLFSCINFILFYLIFSRSVVGEWQKAFSALTISLLPPMYFLSHIYYTDIVSLSMVLLLIILHERGHHYFASLAGFLSILCRQTNVIYVAMYGGSYVLTALHQSWMKNKKSTDQVSVKPFLEDLLRNPLNIAKNMKADIWLNTASYISVIVFFLIYLFLNGSIVVGDRNAHKLSLHIPQLFYFSLFCLIFAWPHFVGEVHYFLSYAKRHKMLMFIYVFVASLIVHYNTLVHPYLLADNRHLIFYIWTRFFAKYWWFRYSLIPVYIFSLHVIVKAMWDRRDISFFIMFMVGTSILLISQSLLELRYFLVPYIIIRFKLRNVDSAAFNVALEFVTYSVMNAITFNIFFTKVLYWSDMEYPQRIMW